MNLLSASRWLLLAVLLIVPWPFGSVLARTYQWFYPPLIVALLLVLVVAARYPVRPRHGGLFLLVLLLPVLWGTCQLVPLSPNLQRTLSPQSVTWRNELGAYEIANLSRSAPSNQQTDDEAISPSSFRDRQSRDVAAAQHAARPVSWHPISVYPVASQRACALLLLAVVVLLLSWLVFAEPGMQTKLFSAVLVSGCAVAVFGILHKLTSSNLIFWLYDYDPNATPFGPFVHRNNAAGYLNLGLAAGIYLAVRRLAERTGQPFATRMEYSPQVRSSKCPRPWLDAPLHGLVFALVLLTGAVLVTASRGGILSMSLGLFVLALLAGPRRHVRIAGGGLLLIAGLSWGLVHWVQLQQETATRLETLSELERLTRDVRVENWRVGLRAAQDFLPAGSGYGTYRHAYLPYEETPARDWFLHAENVFVETLLEGGVPGLLLLLLGLGYLGCRAIGQVWKPENPSALAGGLAMLFLLTTQLAQSCLDLGIYLPSNLLTMAALVGASMSGRPQSPLGTTPPTSHQPSISLSPLSPSSTGRRTRPSTILILVGLALTVGMAAGWRVTAGAALSDPQWLVRPGDTDTERLGREEIDKRIARWEHVVARVPGDAEAHWRLAEWWIERYQADVRDELMAEGESLEEATELSTLANLESRALYLAMRDESARLEQLRQHPHVTNNLLPAWWHLEQARRSCPLLSPVHRLLARLTFLRDDPRRNLVHLERFAITAPCTAETRITLGMMHLAAARSETGFQLLRQAWQQDPSRAGGILEVLRPVFPFDTILDLVIPPDPEELIVAAHHYFPGLRQKSLRQRIVARAESALEVGDHSAALSYYVRAAVAWEADEKEEALDSLRRALELAPDRADWHYQLAQWHAARREFDAALAPARQAVALQVGNGRYRQLLRTVTQRLRQQSMTNRRPSN